MKIQRTPLILLFSAAFLAGGVAVLEANKTATESAPQTDQSVSQRLFEFEEGQIVFLTIERSNLSVPAESQSTLQPNVSPAAEPLVTESPVPDVPAVVPSPSAAPTAVKPPVISLELVDNQWQLSVPLQVPAAESSVAFLTNLLATGQRQQTLNIRRDRLAEFGLDNPAATITITLQDQTQHRLVLGKPTFDRTLLYALIDPDKDANELAVSLVSLQLMNAVDRDLKEWLAEPEKSAGQVKPTDAEASDAVGNSEGESRDAKAEIESAEPAAAARQNPE